MNLKIGNEYWVLTDLDHSYRLGKVEYDALKLCILEEIYQENFASVFKFHEKEYIFNIYNLLEDEIEQWVYKSVDEYLRYLVVHIHNLNSSENNIKYSFDDFLKEKILESQEKYPELWV
jgi:hypothetical protein